MARKKKRRLVRKEVRETPKGSYKRVKLGPIVLGRNSHPFKQHPKVEHYHVGQRLKYVRNPKELRGWWVKWRGRYERLGKVVKEIVREKLSLRGGRSEKRRRSRQGDKED